MLQIRQLTKLACELHTNINDGSGLTLHHDAWTGGKQLRKRHTHWQTVVQEQRYWNTTPTDSECESQV